MGRQIPSLLGGQPLSHAPNDSSSGVQKRTSMCARTTMSPSILSGLCTCLLKPELPGPSGHETDHNTAPIPLESRDPSHMLPGAYDSQPHFANTQPVVISDHHGQPTTGIGNITQSPSSSCHMPWRDTNEFINWKHSPSFGRHTSCIIEPNDPRMAD